MMSTTEGEPTELDRKHLMFLYAAERAVKWNFDLMRSFVKKSEELFVQETPEPDVHHSLDNSVTFVSHTEQIQHVNITQILRYSSFGSAVTALESHFTEMAESLTLGRSTKRVKDMKEKNLMKAYLLAVELGYDLSEIKPQIKAFEPYYAIRNIIAHTNGLVKEKKEFQQIQNFKTFLSIKDNLLVINGEDFTLKFCDLAERFLLNAVHAFGKQFVKDKAEPPELD